MINIFTLPTANDQSLLYLNFIFGSMNGIIPSSGSTTGGTVTLLGTMFLLFNTTILVIGVLMILYFTIVGLMMTAHEGEFMGKSKWSSLWVPIRMVLGIAALVPSTTGYSYLQYIMMWLIIQGVSAADNLWNSALAYVNVMGSPYAQVTLPTVGVTQAMNDLFKGLVCDATARESRPDYSGISNGVTTVIVQAIIGVILVQLPSIQMPVLFRWGLRAYAGHSIIVT